MEREAVILKKENLRKWVDSLRKQYTVFAPVLGNKEYSFREVEDDTDFTLDYVRTMIPPKKFLHPQREELASYHRGNGMEWELPKFDKKQVILGVHPCDARGIKSDDVVFGGDLPDPYYWNRRKNTIIVTVACANPDENCFCLSWDECGPMLKDGFDLQMIDIGNSYYVEIGSLQGSLMVQGDLFVKANEDQEKLKEKQVNLARQKIRKHVPDGDTLPEFLEQHYENEVWEVEAEKCLSCGSCTMVCPTCFCYHVEDFNRWNVTDGKRMRMWDSCQLIDFSEVAMGENFRKDRAARLKWRIYHKLAYWPDQFGLYGCTGCGRCITYCPAKIDMTEVIATIRGEKVHA